MTPTRWRCSSSSSTAPSTTYEHCLRVTRIAYWLNLHWHCHADEVSLVRGAFLHDFYLYDWHNCSNITHMALALSTP